uniref:Uncharacterized protein n=1 Tax=Siphoviridae sp. ctGfF74 TaxID=2826223 RepID=A0A8S5NLD6_9CAUD|nr:MAG TPA: hypothetical protein [Siphoviridae sp. ctGfF74]DAN01977.1 MAG TPA: hypothetical protein [Caudoviricetes sp.]
MTDQQVVRYLTLVDRKLQILLDSGVNYKPEYAEEMEAINKEIAELRPLVEQERGEYNSRGIMVSPSEIMRQIIREEVNKER